MSKKLTVTTVLLYPRGKGYDPKGTSQRVSLYQFTAITLLFLNSLSTLGIWKARVTRNDGTCTKEIENLAWLICTCPSDVCFPGRNVCGSIIYLKKYFLQSIVIYLKVCIKNG